VRRRHSLLADLLDLSSRIHWFAAIGIAAVLWAGLDFLSVRWTSGPPATHSMLQPDGAYFVLGQMLRVLRVALPMILLLGSFAGAVRAWRRRRLYANAVQDPQQMLDGMGWQDFEKLVADAFAHNGFGVLERGGAKADGGVDLVLSYPATESRISTGQALPITERRYLVQCKQWKSKPVDVATVRELLGVVTASAADGGFVVSASDFTAAARTFADGRNIVLIDNRRLHDMVASKVEIWPDAAGAPPSASSIPTCPHCRKPMVKRIAKRGRNTGSPFWGCSQFPDCTGTRIIV
jgi:restriction system protein